MTKSLRHQRIFERGSGRTRADFTDLSVLIRSIRMIRVQIASILE